MNDASVFRVVSGGLAASNKEFGSKLLEINPIEWSQMSDGEIVCTVEGYEFTGVDATGKKYSSTISSSKSIPATWFPFDSNRVTPPDIRRGERVLIWQSGDSDKYYWTDTGLDRNLRRLETVVWAISDVPTNDDTELNFENCYFVEFSTHNGSFTVQTSKANGEPFLYTWQINAKQGAFVLTDDDGNFLTLESKKKLWRIANSLGTTVELDRKDANIEAPGNVNVAAGKGLYGKAGVVCELEAPVIRLLGKVQVVGPLETTETIKAGGGISSSGALSGVSADFTGPVSASHFNEK